MSFVIVSKEEFYAVIGQRDVEVFSNEEETLFTMRNGREVVGRIEGGFLRPAEDEKVYRLRANLAGVK